MTAARSRSRQWTIPTVLALITVAGLLSALIGEGGIWWLVSWGALAVPCAGSVVYLMRGALGAPARHALKVEDERSEVC